MKMEWISVKEKKPKHNETVLTYGKYNYKMQSVVCLYNAEIYCRGKFGEEKGAFFSCVGAHKIRVTHWMPMPDPPGASNESHTEKIIGSDPEDDVGKMCDNCKWYEPFNGVCCNGYSEWCADYPKYTEFGCCEWEAKEKL